MAKKCRRPLIMGMMRSGRRSSQRKREEKTTAPWGKKVVPGHLLEIRNDTCLLPKSCSFSNSQLDGVAGEMCAIRLDSFSREARASGCHQEPVSCICIAFCRTLTGYLEIYISLFLSPGQLYESLANCGQSQENHLLSADNSWRHCAIVSEINASSDREMAQFR